MCAYLPCRGSGVRIPFSSTRQNVTEEVPDQASAGPRDFEALAVECLNDLTALCRQPRQSAGRPDLKSELG